jgi:hypothetical protein
MVAHAASVSREIFEAIEPVEVVDREMRHRARLGEPQVHRDAASPVFLGSQSAPVRDAAARRAEVELDSWPRTYAREGPETAMRSFS